MANNNYKQILNEFSYKWYLDIFKQQKMIQMLRLFFHQFYLMLTLLIITGGMWEMVITKGNSGSGCQSNMTHLKLYVLTKTLDRHYNKILTSLTITGF